MGGGSVVEGGGWVVGQWWKEDGWWVSGGRRRMGGGSVVEGVQSGEKGVGTVRKVAEEGVKTQGEEERHLEVRVAGCRGVQGGSLVPERVCVHLEASLVAPCGVVWLVVSVDGVWFGWCCVS